MEGKKEFLTEENYERGNKKIRKIALIVLIIGLLIGGSLIATGIIKSSHREETISSNTRSKEEIQAEINSLNSELVTLRTKQSQEFTSNGFSEEYHRLENEIKTKESRIFTLNDELMKTGFGSANDSFSKAKYTPFYMFGGVIIFASCMFSGIIYLSTKQRELMAYQVQKVMPIAQEGLEKMAPTIGKAGASIAKEIAPEIGKAGANVAKEMAPVYGDIAKEISKGVKEGLKDEEKK